MSTVKIKTEPTTAAAAAATAVDVQVKLEPSLSTADIKLEQHTSDIDTKVESDSEADSNIKSESDDNDDDEDADQNKGTATPKKQRQLICEHPGCGRKFNSPGYLKMHQHEHRLQAELNIRGKIYTLTRQSLADRWPCPVPDCNVAHVTTNSLYGHVRTGHSNTKRKKQHRQSPAKKVRHNYHYVDVDSFYVNGVRCGYHNTAGVFICQECKLVPECLLTHLQQKHGYDEKSIDNTILPESAVNANADPNVNQHTSNPHLAATICEPYQQQHHGIVKGWLCLTSNCGYCGYTVQTKNDHKRFSHQGEQITTVPALLLHLAYAKSKNSHFLITRIEQASGAVTSSSSGVSHHRLENNHNTMNAQNENECDTSENETIGATSQRQQWKCDYPDCRLIFSSAARLSVHRREHKLEVVITVQGTRFTLSRQSLDDRWPCPVPDCDKLYQSAHSIYVHILNIHRAPMKHKCTSSEDDGSQQQQVVKRTQRTNHYHKVDDFHVNDICCGFHTPTGLFLCYKCKLVPDCLLTHLQQKHGYDEKSIDSSALPASARTAESDPNGNQHTSNSHLSLALRNPNQQNHPDIVKGWLCITSGCGSCYPTRGSKNKHRSTQHKGEQPSIVPALVLRLLYGTAQTTGFLITRLDTANDSIDSNTSFSQYNGDSGDEEDVKIELSDSYDEDEFN